MEIFIPTKEEWQQMQKNLATMAERVCLVVNTLNKVQVTGEHFPESMTIDIAAKYLRCGAGRVKSMIYKQKLLPTHHIDLTTTVYVSKKDLDELKYRVIAIREIEKKKIKHAA